MYQILKGVPHLHKQHVLTYSQDKLVIYSRQILCHLQTFRDYMSNIVAVATSNKGVFVVFCERELIAYKPLLNCWEKSFSKNCSNPISDAFFSHDDKYIIGCSKHHLQIWEVKYNRYFLIEQMDQYELVEMNEIFTVELTVEITNVKFSPDVIYFTTLHSNTLTVWDFEAIKEFPQEGDISQLPTIKLTHLDTVISFKYRETLRINPSPLPTPNTIVTLTNTNILTVWQEITATKTFCKLHSMHLEKVTSFCFIYLKGQNPYPYSPQFVQPDALGVQDTEKPSVDYILVHEEEEMQIIKLDYLRNYSLQESVKVINRSKSNRLLKSIKKVIFAEQVIMLEDKIEIIGFDRSWNIVKVVINLAQGTLNLIKCEKFTYQQIQQFSYNGNVCFLNDWKYLGQYQLRECKTISDEFRVLDNNLNLWKFDNDVSQYQYMFHIKDLVNKDRDIVIFMQNELSSVLLVLLDSLLVIKTVPLKTKIDLEQYKNIQDIIKIQTDQNIELFLVQPNLITHLKISLDVDLFSDNNGVDHVQIHEIKTWKINFKYNKISIVQQPILRFVTIQGKCVKIYDDSLNEVMNIPKNLNIKEVGLLKGQTPIVYIISAQNEIDFHSETGEFLTRFNLNQFLVRVDKSIYDASRVVLRVIPLNNVAFLIQIDNYIVAFYILFDKQDQTYKLNTLKHTYLNERQGFYYKRLSKSSKPQSYQYFETKNSIILKTATKIKVINNSLVACLADLNWMPSTIDYKLISSLNNVQLHDSDFLQELISLGKLPLVNYILRLVTFKLSHHGSLGTNFSVPYKNLLELYHDSSDPQPDWVVNVKTFDGVKLEESVQQSIDLLMPPAGVLIKLIEDGQLGNQMKLKMILDYIQYHEDNSRALDFFAGMFMFYVHMFRTQPSGRKNKVLSSREVVWAMHSLQKETLWHECIMSSDGSWQLIRRYAAVIWMDIQFIKVRLEEIALQSYKKSKDPFDALLYYIMLGKKKVISMLFKSEIPQGLQYKNTYEFLQQDFTQDRWKSASLKNGYALVSKKRYQDAAAFFLLGNHLKDAVNVMALYMEDIQLALLTTKLFEPQGGPVTEALIQEHFIKAGEDMNDIWLLHIGYHLIGKFVDSHNILMREQEHTILEYDNQGKAICLAWPQSYTPQLSYYHPSALLLAEKLRDTLPIKRELQAFQDKHQKKKPQEDEIFASFYDEPAKVVEEEVYTGEVLQLNDNIDTLKQKAIEYYYNVQIPQLGLLFSLELKEGTVHTERLIEQQIQIYICQAIKEQEQFTNYVHLMQKLDDLAVFIKGDKTRYYELTLKYFKQMRSPARLLTFSIHYDQSGLDQFIEFCAEVQSLVYRVCFNTPLIEKTQEFYLTLTQGLYEMDVGLKQFQQSQYYQKRFENKKQLNIIKMFTLFTTLILALELELWEPVFETMRKLETFCHTVFEQGLQDLNYENLRDDFCEIIRDKLKDTLHYRLKNRKANRNADLIGEAFLEDRYNQQISQTDIKVATEPPRSQDLLLFYAIKNRVVKYMLKRSLCYFKKEQLEEKLDVGRVLYSNIFKFARQYKYTRKNVVETFLFNIGDFSFEQQVFEDIRLILKEQSLRNSQQFQHLEQVFNMPQFYQMVVKVQLDSYLERLNIQRTKMVFKYPLSAYEEISITSHKNRIFKQGIEVYKFKTENIRGMCMNNAIYSQGVVLNGKFLRKININNTLFNKIRSQDGYNLIEDETQEDNNRQQQEIRNNNNRPFIVKLAAEALELEECKQPKLRQRSSLFDEYRAFNDKDYIEKFQTVTSTKQVSEDDLQCLTAHPHLPIFLVGGKGCADVVSFKSMSVLSEFQTNSKEYIDSLKFNNSGDIILGHDQYNSTFLWKLHRNSKSNMPLFQLNGKVRPTTDLTFINEGTVFASIYNSSSKPHFGVYDLLLPGNKNIVAQEGFNGTDILFSSPMNSVLICNGKKGTVNFLDLRKNQIYKTLELPFLEVKFFKLNYHQNKLICACNDGTLKIISCDSMETLFDVKPFKQEKKSTTQIVSLCQTENGTYVASNEGVISLAYLNA